MYDAINSLVICNTQLGLCALLHIVMATLAHTPFLAVQSPTYQNSQRIHNTAARIVLNTMTVSFPAVAPALALTACLLPYQVYNSYFAPTMLSP